MSRNEAPQRVVFLNGRFLPRAHATLDVEDRGAMFADGVYEVIRFYHGKPLAMGGHLVRLRDSMDAIGITATDDTRRLEPICRELLERNGLSDAKVYIQITRGAAPREHAFPKNALPTVLVLIDPAPVIDPRQPARGVKAILAPDERWHRCNIKSLMLLPNVIAKNRAVEAGSYEAILHRDCTVTEGTATSLLAWINGELVTHPANQWILPGITRAILLQLARLNGIPVREAAMTIDELLSAEEVLICGSTTHVAGVTQIDEHVIGNGEVGRTTSRMHDLFMRHIAEVCGLIAVAC